MGFIEGGTAILFAIVIYAIYYGITGMQVYKALTADEEPLTRVWWFVGITFASLMVWAIGSYPSVSAPPRPARPRKATGPAAPTAASGRHGDATETPADRMKVADALDIRQAST